MAVLIAYISFALASALGMVVVRALFAAGLCAAGQPRKGGPSHGLARATAS